MLFKVGSPYKMYSEPTVTSAVTIHSVLFMCMCYCGLEGSGRTCFSKLMVSVGSEVESLYHVGKVKAGVLFLIVRRWHPSCPSSITRKKSRKISCIHIHNKLEI